MEPEVRTTLLALRVAVPWAAPRLARGIHSILAGIPSRNAQGWQAWGRGSLMVLLIPKEASSQCDCDDQPHHHFRGCLNSSDDHSENDQNNDRHYDPRQNTSHFFVCSRDVRVSFLRIEAVCSRPAALRSLSRILVTRQIASQRLFHDRRPFASL